ncbi:Hypothetical Protein FCC1311_054632 [Hondaea fermentalgiana]|uniref:Uncharacterized protein n=1 Tax=Hondaea fermentalgiana TaxID=2315210 RepID=A0A2R5GLS9_9STRA|nr:Hypothetical Protein FCC1311_054632 [Hondaea fermentalgiana]|eukprot:GBG29241.1 Hypothetical Protein FCC1311_054632 [Hondaea fermentalgiana]
MATATARPRNVGVLNGARAVSAVIVLFHHIGALDEDLWDARYLKRQREARGHIPIGSGRRMLGSQQQSALDGQGNPIAEFFLHLIGFGPGHLAVEVFLILAGFVAAHEVWYRLARDNENLNEDERFARASSALVRRYQRAFLSRFWRLGLPLLAVHGVHLMLWSQRLAYGPYLSFPRSEDVLKPYRIGMRAIWSSSLSGSLWILETLFLAPFVALAAQLPVMGARGRARLAWYALVITYLSGNPRDRESYSYFTGVVAGAALADLYNNVALRDRIRLVSLPIASVLVSLPWWPGPMYGQHFCLTLSAVGFVYFILYAPRAMQRILDNRLMERAAPYSYQLYIWHLLVFSFFAVNVQPYVPKLMLYIGGFVVSFLVAVPAYHLLEIPSAKAGALFSQWMLARSSTPKTTLPT